MDYIYIGKIVNTHGIKGEIRILSNFKFKDKVFIKDNNIYIGKDKIKETINSYRIHKNYDMITLKNYDNINQVLKYKDEKVYISKNDLKIDGYLDEDLIGLEVYFDNKCIGTIEKIEYIKNNSLIVIKSVQNKNIYIPNDENFIESIDIKSRKVYIKYIEGLVE